MRELNHITLAVTDIDKSFDFYKEYIGLKPLCKWDNGAYFLAGDLWFCLSLDPNRKSTDCYTHYAFSISKEEFEVIDERLTASNIKIFKEDISEGESIYFLDPDGHKLEFHIGNWQSRMSFKKQNPGLWTNIEWFE